jgi:hypothetical protein
MDKDTVTYIEPSQLMKFLDSDKPGVMFDKDPDLDTLVSQGGEWRPSTGLRVVVPLYKDTDDLPQATFPVTEWNMTSVFCKELNLAGYFITKKKS